MTDVNAMVERAAEAIWDRDCHMDHKQRTQSLWDRVRPETNEVWRIRARAALLAALDPEDEALQEEFAQRRWVRLMAPGATWSTSDRLAWMETAKLDLTALRSIVAQGES